MESQQETGRGNIWKSISGCRHHNGRKLDTWRKKNISKHVYFNSSNDQIKNIFVHMIQFDLLNIWFWGLFQWKSNQIDQRPRQRDQKTGLNQRMSWKPLCWKDDKMTQSHAYRSPLFHLRKHLIKGLLMVKSLHNLQRVKGLKIFHLNQSCRHVLNEW